MTFLVMAALVIGSTSVVFAADKVDDTVKSTLVTTAEGLTDAIVQLKDEEIENYMSSGDDFTTSAMQSWQTSKDELGAKKDSNGETTVTFKDDQYTVTVPLKFEKAEANFVYVFDSQGTPTSMSVDVQYGMGKTLQRAGLNTLMGIGTVFVMLILLSLLISLFRFIPNPEAKKAAEASKKSSSASGSNTGSGSSTSNKSNSNTSSNNASSNNTGSSSSATTSKNNGSSSSSSSGSSGSSVSYNPTGQSVVNYACQFVGNPYVWGGTSLTNGADCSGFIMSIYAKFGVSLPHSSGAMAGCGRGVSYSEAMPGDIICYAGHVAIYMGGGQIVHASNAKDGIKISGNAAYRPIVAVRRVL